MGVMIIYISTKLWQVRLLIIKRTKYLFGGYMKRDLKSIFLAIVLCFLGVSVIELFAKTAQVMITGDSILEEGQETTYTISIQNRSKNILKQITLQIDELAGQGMVYGSATSDRLVVSDRLVNGGISVSGFLESLDVNEKVYLYLTVKAPILDRENDLKSVTIKAIALIPGIEEKNAKKVITIFRSPLVN